MKATRSVVLSVLILSCSLGAHAADPMCGTSPEQDEYLKSVRSRPRDRAPIKAQSLSAPVLRDGFFHIDADEEILPGYRPFALAGQSLVLEPRSAKTFAVRREALRYSEPAGSAAREFEDEPAPYVHDLGFEFPIFGRNASRLYITRFNTVHLDPPPSTFGGAQVDEVQAAVQRDAIISPLMIADGKPRQLAYPSLWVEDTASRITLTWRSTEGSSFGYDVQTELHQDGTVVFSYRTPRDMAWGTPLLSAGFDPATAQRDLIRAFSDSIGDVVSSGVTPQVRAMVDIVSTEIARVDGSDLLSVRVKFAGPVSQSHLAAGQSIEYRMLLDGELALISITASGRQVIPFGAPPKTLSETQAVRIDGDTIEFFAVQRTPATPATRELHVRAQVRPQTSVLDTSTFSVTVDPAPSLIASDFAAIAPNTELSLPITQPFLLAPFDPYAAWSRIQSAFGISDHDIDAVAMYQTFYTDLVFYAGAYATGGNAQVDGITPSWPFRGWNHPRSPTLLHMNQLTYSYNSEAKPAARVLLHELGHRWLSFFSIRENGTTSTVINPTGAHPAGWVHTAAAFPVYGDEESSVMGGAYFRPEADGWRTVSFNDGYSWSDLYVMGLAAAEEVSPWFYLANTAPALPNAYWPPHDITVSGQRREVAISQLIDIHGARKPSAGLSQRQFRVLFVLVTEAGREPTEEEIAKVNEWRALLEHNFAVATGGRGSIRTGFVSPAKKRAIR